MHCDALYLVTKEQQKMNKRCSEIYSRIEDLKEPMKLMPEDKFIQGMYENGWKLEIKELEDELTDIIFKACKIIGIKYISINEMEILGDNSCDYSYPWPNIWSVAAILDLNNSCGNGNQHQIERNRLPKKLEGYKWDVETRTTVGCSDKLFTNRY